MLSSSPYYCSTDRATLSLALPNPLSPLLFSRRRFPKPFREGSRYPPSGIYVHLSQWEKKYWMILFRDRKQMPEGAFSTRHPPKLDEARQLHCYPGQDPTKNAPAKKAWRPARSWWPATLQTSKKSQAYGGGVADYADRFWWVWGSRL